MTWWPADGWVGSATRNLAHVPDIRSVMWEVTISPGRPIPWPGDRQTVEWGQQLGTWWHVCHLFNCTLQTPRIIVQNSVTVGKNLMLFHQPRPHYDHFPPNSIDQATKMKQYRSEVGLDGICMVGYYIWLVLPPHGPNPWEDSVLPPH